MIVVCKLNFHSDSAMSNVGSFTTSLWPPQIVYLLKKCNIISRFFSIRRSVIRSFKQLALIGL